MSGVCATDGKNVVMDYPVLKSARNDAENLAAHEDQVRLNAEVMVLVRDVPLDVGIADLQMGEFDVDERQPILANPGFGTPQPLWRRERELGHAP